MIDFDPNVGLMCPMSGHHSNVLCNSHRMIHYRWVLTLLLHMALDYPETRKCQIKLINELIIHHFFLFHTVQVIQNKCYLLCDNCKRCSNFVYQLRHSLFHRPCNFLATMCLNCPTILLHSNQNLYRCRPLSIHDQSKGFPFHLYLMR